GYWAQTPQAKLDRSLSRVQDVLERHKKQWQDGQPEFIRGERNWKNVTKKAYMLQFFDKILIPLSLSPILFYLNLGLGIGTVGGLGLATIIHYYERKNYFDLPHNTFDANLKSFEQQIIEGPLDKESRPEALCVLYELERRFEALPSSDRTPAQRFTLEALRDLITKVALTPKSRLIYSKMLLLDLLQNDITEENIRGFDRLKVSFGEQNNPILATLQHLVDYYNAFPINPPLYQINPQGIASIPNITRENFPCVLRKFIAHAIYLTTMQEGIQRDALVIISYALSQQLRNFYQTTINPLFYHGEAFEKILFFSPSFRFLFSEVQRLAAEEALQNQ
ncbi:MAG TPA: hypothetical protein VLG44_02925, partial [Chlamydiales bacterium]|nr:hypothetical protein [Chlamydiales bacterium]